MSGGNGRLSLQWQGHATEVIWLEGHATEVIWLEGHATEVIWLEGHATEVIWLEGHATEVIWLEGHATEVIWLEGHATEVIWLEGHATEVIWLEGHTTEVVCWLVGTKKCMHRILLKFKTPTKDVDSRRKFVPKSLLLVDRIVPKPLQVTCCGRVLLSLISMNGNDLKLWFVEHDGNY